jgi:TP901 family phage tail tape measure protein
MANSAVVGILKAILSLDTAEFINGIRQSSNAMGAWTKDLKDMSRQAQNIGLSLSKVLTLPILAVGTAASKAAIDFESSFAGVGKTVDGVMDAGGQLTDFGKSLQQSFRDLAKQIPINVNELNRVGEAAGALGIKKDDIKEFTRVMALLGVTTNLTADDAAAGIAKIQNIFGEAGKETDRFGAALVALGNNGASTESQILDMATRIAGAGHTIGMTQAQVLGVANALASVGLEADAGGTAISRVMINMASSVSAGGKKLEEFAGVAGMTADQFAAKFKTDAAGALTLFVQGLGRVKQSGGDLFATLDALGLSEIRVRDAMLRVAGAGDMFVESVKMGTVEWQKNTALVEEARKRFNTTASALQTLRNQFVDIGITIGNALLPMIKSLSSILSALFPIIDSVAHGFAALPGPIQAVIVGIAGAAAATGPAIYAFGQLVEAAGNVSKAFSKNGIATRLFGSSMQALPGVVRTLGAALAGPLGLGLAGISLGFIAAKSDMDRYFDAIEKHNAALKRQAELLDAYRKITGDTGAVQIDFTRLTQDQQVKLIEMAKAAEQARINAGNLAVGLDDAKGGLASNAKAAQDYTDRLKDAKAEIARLTPDMRQQIDNALALGEKMEDVGRQFHLSSDAQKIYRTATKETSTALRDAANDEREYQENLQHTYSVLKSMGITTTDMVLRSMGELQEAFSIMIAQGVPMDQAFGTILPKLIALADEAKRSGVNVDALNEFLRETQGVVAATAPSLSGLVRAFDPMQSIAGVKAVSFEMTKLQDDTRRTTDAFHAFGLKTPAEMAEASRAARQHFNDLLESGQATAEQLDAAWEDVLKAEGATRKQALSYWKDWAHQVEQIGRDLAKQFASTLLGIRGQTAQEHQRSAEDAKKSYDETVADSKQTLAQAQQDARNQYDQTTQSVKDGYNDQLAALLQNRDQTVATIKEQEDAGLLSHEDAAKAIQDLEIQQAEARKQLNADTNAKLEAANQTMNDTITAAAQKSHDDIAASQAAMQQAIEDASHPFRDNMVDLWHSIRDAFNDVMSQMLGDFIEIFIKGSLAALAGNKGAFSGLLSSMFSGVKMPSASSIVPSGTGTVLSGLTAPGTTAPTAGLAAGVTGVLEATGLGAAAAAGGYLLGKMGTMLWQGISENGLWGQNSFDERDRDAMINALGLGQYGYQYSTDQLEQMLNEQGLSFEKGTNGSYVDFGSGTLAMLHGHEKITPYGADDVGAKLQGDVLLDGRKVGAVLWKPMIEDLQRRGVTR